MVVRLLIAAALLAAPACATPTQSGNAASDLSLSLLEEGTERPPNCRAPTLRFDRAQPTTDQPVLSSAVLYDAPPAAPHTVLGELSAEKGACGDQSTGTLRRLLKEHASLHGCAGVIMLPTQLKPGPRGPLQHVSGHCIRFE